MPLGRRLEFKRLLPFLVWLPAANRQTLKADALAGLVGAIVVLPQGVAFATLAGLPPQYGLYAAMVPAVIAALFGSSYHLVSGPTNALSILLFAQLAPIAEPGSAQYVQLALMVAFLTGAMQLALGLARMGILVNFISHSVIVGFTSAAGLLIIASQARNFFGVEVSRGSSFFETLHTVIVELANGHFNLLACSVGLFTLLVGMIVRRMYPRMPYMVFAVVAGSLWGAALTHILPEHPDRLLTIGSLPGALPQLSAPSFTLESLRAAVPIAVGMTLLGLTEALSIARSIAIRSGQRIDANQEFIGQGLSNLAGAFFSAYPSSGSFNRSGANFEAGAKTPLATILASIFLVAVLYIVAPLAAHLPLAVMAAILLLVGYGLIDAKHVRQIARTSRREGAVMLATFLTGIFVDLEFAILAGVLFSLIVYLQRTSKPVILDVKPDAREGSYHFTADSGLPDCPQVKMLRINGSLYFGAVDNVARALAAVEHRQKHVVIVASGINFIDIAGAELLATESGRRRQVGGGLYFYRVKDEVRRLLDRGGYLRTIGAENLFPVRQRVIAAIYPKLDCDICRTCRVRIFAECREYLPDGTRRTDGEDYRPRR